MRFINEIQAATSKSTLYQVASAPASNLLAKGAEATTSAAAPNQSGVTYSYRDFAQLKTSQLLSDSPVRAMPIDQIEILKKSLERSINDTSEVLLPASHKRPLASDTSFDLPAFEQRSSIAPSNDSGVSAPKRVRLSSLSSANEPNLQAQAPMLLLPPSPQTAQLNDSRTESPRRSSSSSSCLYSPPGALSPTNQSATVSFSFSSSPLPLRHNSAASSASNSNRSPVYAPAPAPAAARAEAELDSPFSPPPQNRGASEHRHGRHHHHHHHTHRQQQGRENAESNAEKLLFDQFKFRISSLVKSRLSPVYYHDITSTEANSDSRVRSLFFSYAYFYFYCNIEDCSM